MMYKALHLLTINCGFNLRQIVPLAFVEGFVYKWFAGPMLKGMHSKYAEEQKQHAVVAFQSSEQFRKTFDMKNRLVIFLLSHPEVPCGQDSDPKVLRSLGTLSWSTRTER